jgi:hypothetical protein
MPERPPSIVQHTRVLALRTLAACVLLGALAGCLGSGADADGWWAVEATVESDQVFVEATISQHHTDFIHMSIRKHGWDNGYSIGRSPDPMQPDRDWSRVHHWFGELHPDTYLEGRIDDGRGRGPAAWTTVRFALSRSPDAQRREFPDANGSDYAYITTVYAYADGHLGHPGFEGGDYEIEIYPWYTGSVDAQHRASDDSPEVQYLHHEVSLASTTFVIE